MKKYISLLAIAIAAVLSSCSNDEITISKTVNFTVNPAGVVNSFSVAEEHPGELESFDTDCKLNVCLFIYDEDGTLVKEFANTYSNYAVQFKVSDLLPQGKYTAVAVTHIEDIVENRKYWIISGKENLEGMQITDAGYIGGQNKVLGISVSNFDVRDDIVDVNMNVHPAGSMLTVRYYGYDYLSKFGYNIISLHGNKIMDYLQFDRSGNSEVIADNHNGSYDWVIDYVDVSTIPTGYSYYYNYEYVLPMTNVGLQFFISEDDIYNTDNPFGNSTTFETLAGSAYYGYFTLQSNGRVSVEFGTYSNKTRGIVNESKGVMSLQIKNKNLKSITKGQSLRVKDYI